MARVIFLIGCLGLAVSSPAWAQVPASASTDWLTIPWIVSTGIALAAFLRPDVTRFIRRLRVRLELFEWKRIEVGFGNLGPSLGLGGTLRGVPSDQFVQSMMLTLVRTRDNLTHKFEWAALRPLGLAPGELKDVRLAMGFKLAGGEAVPVNVLFLDGEMRERVEEQMAVVRQEWLKYSASNRASEGKLDYFQEYQNFTNGQVSSSPAHAHAELNKLFYFAAGEYQVDLAIKTWDPELTFRFKYKFTLSKEQENEIRLGTVSVVMLACSHPHAKYHFVTPVLDRI